MTRAGVICAGNWIVDIVHNISHWPQESDLVRIASQHMSIGGGPANVISALARLEPGFPLWPLGAIGDDEFGQYVLDSCRAQGLPTDRFIVKPGLATAHTHVMSVPGKTRTFFYHGGANDSLSETDFLPRTFRDCPARIFYLGYPTLLAALDQITEDGTTAAGKVLARARAAGMQTVVDLVSTDGPEFSAIVAGALPHIDYLVLNEVELARATGQAELMQDQLRKDDDLIAMAKRLIGQGVRQAVIVHCPQKALWVAVKGSTTTVRAKPLPAEKIASALGAGDSFCAGVLVGLHANWTPNNALDLGHKVARASLQGVSATEAIPKLSELGTTLQ